MNTLPTCLENIIYSYLHQLKFAKVLDEIKKIEYEITDSVYCYSTRGVEGENEQIEYFANPYDYEDELEEEEQYDLEVFGKGWSKINSKGKIIFYSSVY